MCKITYLQWFIFIVLLIEDATTLRDVLLTIEPKIVQRLHTSTLRCTYDLENATLYSVKWYRGKYEFYRYTPSENPSSKVFLFGGIQVDVNRSNCTQVELTDIEFNLAGNFSCEVTTTDEPASTGTDTQSMTVVQLPEYSPKISVDGEPLDYGDTLRANCTSPPARPAATLRFLLNNLTVARSPFPSRKPLEAQWSDLTLDIILTEFHFDQGKLVLRCVAQIGDIYREEAVLPLMSAREPIPETRVGAFNTASSFPSNYHMMLPVILLLHAALGIKS